MTELLVFGLILISCSGFFLKYVLKSKNSTNNSWIPLVSTLGIIVISTQLRDFKEALVFFAAALAQFAAYVFVSRLRQRGSFFWHVMAALASNSAFYATMHTLKMANGYYLLFIPYIVGLIAERISGVMWAQFVEQRYQLKADATRDDRLAPGQRLNLLTKEWTFWALVIGLTSYTLFGYTQFETSMFRSILVVIGLGVIQNFFYALGTRASARGNSWYIVTTGVLQGVTFYINAVYLFSHQMPLALVVPYVFSTVLGSATGAVCSMVIEYVTNLRPDAHLEQKITKKNTKLPHGVVLSLAVIWIFFQEQILNLFGYQISELKFPFSFITAPLPRLLIMVVIAFIFMLDSAFHTLTSRAGNRNHTGYHITTLVPKGFVDFFRMSYLALNDKIPDVVPVAVLGGSLGSLFGKDVAEKVEKWLQARMDVEPEPARKPAPASSTS